MHRQAVEHYLLEVVARSEVARERCRTLLALEYPSDAPGDLTRTLAAVFSFLVTAAERLFANATWNEKGEIAAEDLRLLRYTDHIICHLAETLRSVEAASTNRLPREIVPAFEGLARDLVPNVTVMFRPQWTYNYTFTLTDMRQILREYLSGLADEVPERPVDANVLASMPAPFHVVAFPQLEQDNILLHCLLGHELGHLLADRFVDEDRKARFSESVLPEVQRIAEDRMKAIAEQIPLLVEPLRVEIVNSILENVIMCWRRALEELLSDVVGAIIFGPAALFSTFEMAWRSGYDACPSEENNYYPPWRLRLRTVLDVVNGLGSCFPVSSECFLGDRARERSSKINAHVEMITEVAAGSADPLSVPRNAHAELAYRDLTPWLKEGLQFLMDDCGMAKLKFRVRKFGSVVPVLVERLDRGIPPNAVEASIDDRTRVRLAHIINAAWYAKLSELEPTFGETELNPVAVKSRSRRNRLTIKAVQFAHLADEYWRTVRPKQFHDDTDNIVTNGDTDNNVKNVERAGALGREDLVRWLERSDLEQRLVVTPLLDPCGSIGPSSIDVRLGAQYVVMSREAFPGLDVAAIETIEPKLERYHSTIVRSRGEGFVLHPGQLVIGSTLEYVQVPKGLMAYVIGKSSLGRMGLIIATATKVDPGFRGCITLEIVNEGEVPLVLYPGSPVAQLVLHHVNGESVYSGRYECPTGPEFPRFGVDKEAGFWWPRKPRKSPRKA